MAPHVVVNTSFAFPSGGRQRARLYTSTDSLSNDGGPGAEHSDCADCGPRFPRLFAHVCREELEKINSRPWAKIKPGGLRLSLGTLRVPGRLRRPNYQTPFTWIDEPHLISSM